MKRIAVSVAVTLAVAATAGACSIAGQDASRSARPVVDAPARCAASEPAQIDYTLDVDSAVYSSTQRIRVHLTPCTGLADRPLPVLYLLHGAGADETQWPDVGFLEAADSAVAAGTFPPAVIVAPDAGPAYDCSECTEELTSHLLTEIEPAITAIAPIDTDRRVIGGISRGGGLALRVAGRTPEAFVAVGAHSPVTAPDTALRSLAEHGVPLYIDVGVDDGLAGAAESMARHLIDLGGIVSLDIGDGGHDRSYWRSNVSDYAAFYGQFLDPDSS